MGIIDIAIVLIFLAFVIFGFIGGFLKQVLSSLSWIIALIAATLLCNFASDILMETTIGISLNGSISNWIASKGEFFATPLPDLTSESFSSALTQIGVPTFLHKIIFGFVDFSQFSDVSIAEFVSPKIADFLLTIISYILIYLIVFIVLKIIGKIFSHVVRSSALGIIDGMLGAIWGAIKATIIVSLVLLGISFIVTTPIGASINEWITEDMGLLKEEFGIAKFLYQNNPLLFLISKISIFK